MAGLTDHSADNPAYINTGTLNATKYTSWAAAATALGGAVVGIVKAAHVNISDSIMIAVLGAVAVALIALAIVVAADVLARARVKAAQIALAVAAAEKDHDQAPGPAIAANGSSGPVSVTVDGRTVTVGAANTPAVSPPA